MPTFKRDRGSRGFTLVEILVTLAVSSVAFALIFQVFGTALRLSVRNLSSNIGHETLLLSSQRMTYDLEEAATGYGLVNWSSNVLYDVGEGVASPNDLASSGTADAGTGKTMSKPANGVKFRRTIGPGLLLDSVAAGGTTVRISLPLPAQHDTPNRSDVLYIPLLSNGYRIASTSAGSLVVFGTVSKMVYTLTLSDYVRTPITMTGTNSTVSVVVLKRAAYAVVNQVLYYFPTIPDSTAVSLTSTNVVRVRGNVMTPQPFSLLYDANGTPDNKSLRTILQAYDSSSGQRTESTNQKSTLVTLTMPRFTQKNARN